MDKPERRITCVKLHKDGEVEISHMERHGEAWNEFTCKCVDPPKQSLKDAMAAVGDTLAEWLDMNHEGMDWWLTALDVRKVSISWTKDIMGATVTAFRPCSANAPLCINAPHKPAEAYNGDPDEKRGILTDEQRAAIERVIREAEAYLDGDRAQGMLDLGDAPVVDLPKMSRAQRRVLEGIGANN